MSTPERDDGGRPDRETRERSAEERNITAPTPRDVREKAEGDDGPEPPAADSKAP